MDSRAVTFVERGGPGARGALSSLRDRLLASGRPARLLASRDQEALYLLVVEGEPEPDSPELEGARTWRFREAPEAGPHSVESSS